AKAPTPMDLVPVEAHYSRWIADEAIEFIRDSQFRRAGQPFYFTANFFDPHHPFGAPREYRDLYDKSKLAGPVGGIAELETKPRAQMEYSAKSYAGHAPGYMDYSSDELLEVRAQYYAMITLIDNEVQRIVSVLDELNVRENT